ncbi:MAG: hypothetical protein ACOYJU_08830 [Anaerovoracaceae bacterium]|jgi:tetratricopeptide (TPR) repeat protein
MAEKKKTLAQAMGITRTVIRPIEEMDVKIREDRIGRYFKKYLKRFVFVEFSDEFLEKSKVKDIMKGVPVPLRKEDVKEFAGGAGLKATHIGENMAWVMGSDPKFKYTEKYVAYLSRLFNYKIYEGMLKLGRDAAEKEDFDNACIHFRACLCMKPDYLHGMYSYARVCRAMYMASSDPEYVGRFKAEALDYFELLTETHPRFAQGYYYLGYAYLNLGLYSKTFAAWNGFLKFTRNGKDRREINQRMKQIQDPMRIEEGCNEITALRFEKGVEILEPYLDTKFKDWWPLHYYLGVGYARTERIPDAVARFKNALGLNPSHLETMEELADIYEMQKDKENTKKFRKKIQLIRADIEAEKEEASLKAARDAREWAAQKEPEIKVLKDVSQMDEGAEEKEEEKESQGAVTKAGVKRLVK